jgi:hypothetical protein
MLKTIENLGMNHPILAGILATIVSYLVGSSVEGPTWFQVLVVVLSFGVGAVWAWAFSEAKTIQDRIDWKRAEKAKKKAEAKNEPIF